MGPDGVWRRIRWDNVARLAALVALALLVAVWPRLGGRGPRLPPPTACPWPPRRRGNRGLGEGQGGAGRAAGSGGAGAAGAAGAGGAAGGRGAARGVRGGAAGPSGAAGAGAAAGAGGAAGAPGPGQAGAACRPRRRGVRPPL